VNILSIFFILLGDDIDWYCSRLYDLGRKEEMKQLFYESSPRYSPQINVNIYEYYDELL